MTKMKALVKAKAEKGIWMQEVDIPVVGPNDVLIKIVKTAICGTDLHIYKWDDWAKATIPVPMVVGHEYCGYVAAVGSEVVEFKEGDRVTGASKPAKLETGISVNVPLFITQGERIKVDTRTGDYLSRE